MGCRTLSASCATLLQVLAGTLPVPFTWLRMSPICFTHSSMCGWKLGTTTCRQLSISPQSPQPDASHSFGTPRPLLCPLPLPSHPAVPGGKDSAQIIQDVVKFHLQFFEDVTGFCVQLQEEEVVEADRVPEPALREVSASQMHPWAG